MHASPPNDDWTRFAVAVFALNSMLVEAGEGIVAPLGQSSARWQVLGRAFAPTTVAHMARDIGHARQSVQRVADDLLRDGLLEYRPHPQDRHTQLAALTPRGREVLEAIYNRQLAWSRDVVARIGADQLRAAIVALTEVAESLGTASHTPGESQ
ncbi:MarR family winged helix-turn-helix transcriptional regulator [Glaciihabitans sp. UYNi722]|uniref:MarR family winged helix-turn-helix transcriptional regulator n=1 Tax=Glaciihabitans sp. UYNi722 TaxID=3156344 RepID=UPI00339304BA